MKELQICLENCDMIKVPWESVVNLSIYKVHKTYHFSKNMNLEMLVADDGGYIECFLYLDNANKVSFTYFNKHKNTKDMTKEDANKEVIKFLDNYVTIKRK